MKDFIILRNLGNSRLYCCYRIKYHGDEVYARLSLSVGGCHMAQPRAPLGELVGVIAIVDLALTSFHFAEI